MIGVGLGIPFVAVRSGFSPAKIAGLQLWLNADVGVYEDAGTTPATDTSNVQQWNDQSGNSRNASQATGARQPIYSSGTLPGSIVPLFDGTDDVMAITATNLASPYTIFIVGSISNANGYLFDGNPFDAGGISYSTGLRLMTSGGNITGVSYTLGTPAIFTAINNGASSSLQVNDNAPGTGTCGGSLVSPWQLGGLSGMSFGIGGFVSDVLVYNSALSAANVALIKNFLNARRAIY